MSSKLVSKKTMFENVMEIQEDLLLRLLEERYELSESPVSYDQSDCFETGGVDTRTDAYLEWMKTI